MITKTFAFHNPSKESHDKINGLRSAFSEIGAVLVQTCPPSRELSLAQTDLEQAAMWAIKSVVSNDAKSTALVED